MSTAILEAVAKARSIIRTVVVVDYSNADVTTDGLADIKGHQITGDLYITLGVDSFQRLTASFTGQITAKVKIVARIYKPVTQTVPINEAEIELIETANAIIKAYCKGDQLRMISTAEYRRVTRLDRSNFIVGEVAFDTVIEA